MAHELLLSKCSNSTIGSVLEAGKRVAAWQIALMVKRIALVRVVCFCLLAACGAVCQSEPPATSLKALPDAPSACVSLQAPDFQTVGDQAHWPLPGGASTRLGARPDFEHFTPGPRSAGPRNAAFLYPAVPEYRQSDVFFFKHLYPSSLEPNLRYRASASNSLMGRATDAASRIFVARDESGKRRFNTSYLLQVATSVAAHSASRTYRARSSTAPLGDLGSTVGNDAGMNLLHEFGPAVRKMATGHLPEFVSRLGERIIH
jgi:hypothetical protein